MDTSKGKDKQLREAIERVLDTYGGKYKPREYSDKILALFTTTQIQLVTELIGELPEKLVNTKEESDTDYFYGMGANSTLDLVTELLEHKKQELERGK